MRTLSATPPRQALLPATSTSLTHTAHPPVHRPKQASGSGQAPSAVAPSVRLPSDAEKRDSALHPAAQGGVLPGVVGPVLLLVLQEMLGEFLLSHLARTRKFRWLGLARHWEEIAIKSGVEPPEIVALDGLPRWSEVGITLERVRAVLPEARLVLFNSPVDHASLQLALRQGVLGYLSWDASPAELVQALELAHHGQRFFSSSVVSLIEQEYARRVAPRQAGEGAPGGSARQEQIMNEVAQGRSSKEIAQRLSLSPRTVENHRQNYARNIRRGA